MSTITVTTASDSTTLNPNDGVTTLREAIAQAAAGDTIVFAASLDNQTITLSQGLVVSHDLIIDGDRNNDGLADIMLNGQSNGHALPIISITGATTHVLIDGVTFTNGGSHASTGASGADGADASGSAQDGVDLPPLDTPYEGERFEDDSDGLPGGNGTAAPSGGDGEGFDATAGAISNAGFLTLRNTTFIGNAVVGGNGGDGGSGTTSGAGGSGGDGGQGWDLASTRVTIDLGLLGSYDIDVIDPFNAARGGNGGDGGAGANGGNGGDGGAAAGAIVNFGDLTLENVSFRNNSATGGSGGSGGNAGAGGAGGTGGTGGGRGSLPNGASAGDGGNGGNGGAGGSGGDGGAAAGAILNYGTLTGYGAAVSVGNSANGNTAGTGGTGGAGGASGSGGDGGDGYVVDGPDGHDGAAGATGANGANGQAGAADGFLVNAAGGSGLVDATASTIVYLAIDHAAQYEGHAGNATVFHVYVNRAGDLSHASSVEVSLGFAFPNPEFDYPVSTNQYDFAGGVFPSGAGTLIFAVNEQQKVITITIAGDTQVEGNEQFSVSLGMWSGMQAGATIQVVGTILNDDTDQPPSTGDAPVISDYQGDSAIFTENAGPVFIDVSRNSQILDTDSPYLNGGRLTITISQNYTAGQDVLSFVNEPNGVSLQDDILYFGAAQIGQVTNTGAILAVDFAADATPTLVSQILRSVTYNNLSDTPSTALRTISVTVSDADGNVSETRTGTVSVHAVDDGPIIDLDVDNSSGATGTGYKTSYAPGSAGVGLLDSDVNVTDPDGSTFDPYAIISIASPKTGDLLSVVGTLPAGIQVLQGPGFTDATTIWLTGNGTYAQYVEALRHIQYSNTEANPDRTTRDIRISLGGENSHASVVVGVPPGTPNDNNGATNSVIEGAVAGTAVGITALASDSDGNPITYSLDDDAGSRFAINASTGVVTVSAAGAGTIDYETTPGHAYGITVRASDGTGFSTTRNFSIAVANFTPPTPTDSNGAVGGTVQEGAANGTSVGITASSSEPGGIIYSLVGSDGRFAIDAATGVVTVADASRIDYESATSHTITVRAADAGGAHSADRSFIVAVTNAPPSTPVDTDGAAGGSIAENAALHDPVGIKVAAADPNGGAVTWSLANSAGGRFAITNLGVVVVLDPDLLDYETNASHTIVVRAKDAAGLYTDQSVTIAVTDTAPSAPVDTDGTSGATVDEGLRGISGIGGIDGGQNSSDPHGNGEVGITAQSSDPRGGTVTYSLSDDAGGLFSINAGTGVVTVAPGRTLNQDGALSHDYAITVLASAGSLSTSQTFTVTVNNVAPFAPEDIDAAADSVAEGAADGATVGLTLVSGDPGGASFTWSLTDDADGRFAIDANGVVTVADASLIDYESSGGAYTIVAQVSDGSLTATQSFTIAVANAAPSAPTDTDGVTGGTIAEDAAAGATVGITAASADPNGGMVTYSLTDDAGARFGISSLGVVFVAEPTLLDYESHTSHTIVVRAADASGLFTDQSFTITVSDVAPSTPADADGTSGATIDEGLGAGAAAGITAQSSDVHGGTITYSLTDNAGGLFAIDPTTGVVTVASGVTIDQDGAPSQDYSITVKASAGSLAASQTFTVTVNNVAPAAPVDSDGTANTVSEGVADGDSVGLTLISTDPGGATLTWSLTDDADGRFAIDANGVVTAADASRIDYEGSGGSYTIVAQVSDGSLTSTLSFTIAVTNVAPASTDDSYTIDEDATLTVAAPGTLGNDSDVNGGALTATLQDGPLHAANFVLNADGSFSYTPAADYNGDDSFTYTASDGTVAGTPVTVAITVNAVNDAPEVSGAVVLAVISEDSGARLIIQADLLGTASDVDGPTLEARNLAILAGAGSLVDHHDGTWTYAPALNDDTAVSFSYQVTDGVADPVVATATLDVTPVNDAPAGAGGAPSAGTVAAEQVATVIDPTVIVIDPDNATLPAGTVSISGNFHAEDALAFLNTDSAVFGNIAAVYAAASGVLTLASAGATATLAQWQAALRAVTYTNTTDAPHTADRTIDFVLDDGVATSTVATAIVGVAAINDAPVHALPAAQTVDANHTLAITGLSIADPDAGTGMLTTTLAVAHGTLTLGAGAAGNGTGAVTLTGTLDAINAALAGLSYAPTHDFFGYDTLTVTTNDGGNAGDGGALAATDQLAIKIGALATGSTANEDYEAPAGNQKIDAGEGDDAITFNFKLTDATISHVGNTVVIDGPGSHTVLSGFETFRFADGTVDNKDGEALVDDLFYYSKHHDVWTAHLDADAHYHAVGWHQGFDPNAFFSTTIYLSANPDVQASGLDPLAHFHQTGWAEGRVASPAFDTRLYLAANPDVVGIDPLAHFLQFGYQENRQPVAATELIASNGFDYVWYLDHNPDVTASNVDPFAHFMTVGWTEGRNPNALFDVDGYLATYTDVAAAHVNPLTHYNEFGRHEGRDPSVGFDTTAYLAANSDVAASHVNPLTHFLQFGIHEGRLPFADGVWG